jgi:hypothetical protein
MIRWGMRRSIPYDARTILHDLRKDDVEEWAQSVSGGIENLLGEIQESAECWTCHDQHQIAHVIAGVKVFRFPEEGDTKINISWMIGTNTAELHAVGLMKEFYSYYQGFFGRWPDTWCYTDVRNVVHHRWLAYWGYEVIREIPYGPNGAPFYEMRRCK